MYGLALTKGQASKIANAAKKHSSVEIRLTKNSSQGNYKLPLTQTQINQINKSKNNKKGMNLKLSASQLKHLEKTGGLLPLLALLPLIFGGIGAAGGVAGGVASAVSAVNNAKAAAAAQAETERHNREVEAQLKTGTGAGGGGIISDFVGKAPVIGSFFKPLLQKIGLGTNECKKVMNGSCVHLGEGLFLRPSGEGLFIGPPVASQGSGACSVLKR